MSIFFLLEAIPRICKKLILEAGVSASIKNELSLLFLSLAREIDRSIDRERERERERPKTKKRRRESFASYKTNNLYLF